MEGHLPKLGTIALALCLMFALFWESKDGASGCTMPTVSKPNAVLPEKTESKSPSIFETIDAATLHRVGSEALWAELAEAFRQGSDAPTDDVIRGTDWAGFGLAADEIAFYRSVRSLLGSKNSNDFVADDWLRWLRQAGFIFEQTRAVFEKTKAGAGQFPARLWSDAAAVGRLLAAMKTEFNLTDEQVNGLLKKYPQAGVGKWASLVFYLQN